MKFVHIADMHFDMTFDSLNGKELLGEKRRLEQRLVFEKVIKYIKENNIPYLFISGDFYEQKSIRESTIEFINNEFMKIEDTKIFISPGNHDPYIKNSYYNTYKWADNVKIFSGKFEKIEMIDCNIYGYGFEDFYCANSGLEGVILDDKDKLNILVIHADLNASEASSVKYNPVNLNMLKEKKFDYVALGHIHKNNIEIGNNIIYPGSTVSGGFDELGEHGMVVGDLTKENLNIEFISLDPTEFLEYEVDVTEINSKEELVENLNNLYIPDGYLYKILLTGIKNFEINTLNILKLIENKKILKIKDCTRLKYNLQEISKEISLRGFFVKNLLEKQKNGEYLESEIEKAIEIGLDVL